MIIIERFSKKYSSIFTDNSDLLLDRKLYPPAVIKYALNNKNSVLIAISNKQPIGFIIGFIGENKNSILTIFVNKEQRNNKIGALLVNTLLQQKFQKQNNLWTVRLRSIDYPIIGFFENCKFKIITELNLYQKNDTNFTHDANNNLPGNFRVVIGEHKHIQNVIEIEKVSFDPFWHRTYDEWKTIFDDETNIVYVMEEEIDGVVNIVGFSHNSINATNGIKEGQYIRIAVNPNYRKIGIATKLTRKAFEFFKRHSVRRVYLTTKKNDLQLNTMYQKWGFELFDVDTILGIELP